MQYLIIHIPYLIAHTSYFILHTSYLIPHRVSHTSYLIPHRVSHSSYRIHMPYLIKTNARRRHSRGIVSQSRCSGYRSISGQNQPRSPRISPDAKNIAPARPGSRYLLAAPPLLSAFRQPHPTELPHPSSPGSSYLRHCHFSLWHLDVDIDGKAPPPPECVSRVFRK